MTKPGERSPRSVGTLAAAFWMAGCVSLDLDPAAGDSLCEAVAPAHAPRESVVLITTDLAAVGVIRCSGVLVAPTIVITNLSCVTLPSGYSPSDLDGPSPLSIAGIRQHSSAVDYATSCQPDAGWAPREDGSFSAQPGAAVAGARMTVAIRRDRVDLATSNVRRVVSPRTPSRCFDALAVLVLEQPLQLPRLPLRLDDDGFVGESITLSGFERNQPDPYQFDSTVEALTFETGDALAPPRSLLIHDQVCWYEFGGAVAARASGALIGVIASATGTTCGDPTGRTIATRLAPFRNMLSEVAADTGEVLPVEPSPRTKRERLPLCE